MRHEVVDNVVEPDARADEPDPPAARGQGRHDRTPARRPTAEHRRLHHRGSARRSPRAATSCCAAGARPACCARCRTSSASASRARSTQRVAWLHGAASAPTTSASPKTRSGAATAPMRRACTRSSASPGAIRCSTTSCSTPTASRSTAAREQIAALARRPEFAETDRVARDARRTWRSQARVRAALRADEATRDGRRHGRRATHGRVVARAASSLDADETARAERGRRGGAGRRRASTTSCG